MTYKAYRKVFLRLYINDIQVVVMDIGADTGSQEVVDAFTTGAGEVKYFRWCTKDGSDQRLALVEFTDYGAIPAAMRLNNTVLGESTIKVERNNNF